MLAKDRGLTVSEMRSTVSQDYVSLIALRAETGEGPSRCPDPSWARITSASCAVNDFDIEAEPAGNMVFFTYEDRPGVIAASARSWGSTASTSPRWTSAASSRWARR